jgi:tetratricopeptide (TPR) repeat protein
VWQFSPDGHYLATADEPGRSLKVWDVDQRAIAVDDPGPAGKIIFSPDSRRILVVRQGKLFDYELSTGRQIRIWPGKVSDFAFRPDGSQVALIDNDSKPPTCRILDAGPGRLLRAFPLPEPSENPVWSPDGKWLVAGNPRGRLWEVRTWRESKRSTDVGWHLSPDGRFTVVIDPSRIIRLVEFETGRTLARLESPDQCGVGIPTFSPDGSRLVFTTHDGPSARVWNLRAIRRRLTEMGLDWDAPAYSEDDPADPSLPPLPQLQVDYGPLAGHLEHHKESPESLLERYTARLNSDPNDADAFHHRAHALASLRRISEAIADLTRAIDLRPNDAHYRSFRGAIHGDLKQYDLAITDLEAALALKPDQPSVREELALCCNNRAWELAAGPEPRREVNRALALARRAVELAPSEGTYLNTLGVALYRAGRYGEAIPTVERSRAANRGQFDGFDLFFRAMAHHRLGHRGADGDCFDRAVRWMQEQKQLPAQHVEEL